MKLKELLEKRAALLAEANKPETTAERFAEIRSEVEKLNFTIAELQADERAATDKAAREAELRGARLPNGGETLVDTNKTPTAEERARVEKVEKRAKSRSKRVRLPPRQPPSALLQAATSTPRLNKSARSTNL